MRAVPVIACATVAAFAGCGGDDGGDEAPATTAQPQEQQPDQQPRPEPAPLRDGQTFHPNDLADCLLDADVGAAVSLDGAAIDLHDAQAQVIVEQGNGEILVYDSADAAAAAEERYRESFGRLSEVVLVRNVLFQADPDLPPEAKAKVEGCLGA